MGILDTLFPFSIEASRPVQPEFEIEDLDDIEDSVKHGKFKNMVFGISDESTGNYGMKKRTFKRLDYPTYIHKLKRNVIRNPQDFIDIPFKKYPYITGRVKRGIVKSLDKYLMIIDCDSVDGRKKAICWLDNKDIRHFSIQSSPSKFWIICDIIDTVGNHTHMMDEIPGIDTKYTDCSRQQNVLLFRGFPKPGFIPQFDDMSNFTGMGVYEKWILNLKEYWESDDMVEIANNLFAEAL